MTAQAPFLVEQELPRADSDNPWKHAFDVYFRGFLECCLPEIAQNIDWTKGYELLDKELKKITYDAAVGNRVADKLVKVWEKNGQETWFLLHLDVQGSYEKVFPERMLVYRYRIRDRYHKPIVSIAILIDGNPKWRTNSYQENYYGSSLQINYLVVKLLDFRSRRQELEAMNNPFASVILAQLAVLDTQRNPQARLQAKTALTRQLYEKGWGKSEVLQLYTLVDWLIALPRELMIQYDLEVSQIEEEKQVNYVTTAELLGMERGMQRGIEKGIEKGFQQGEAALLMQQLKWRFHHIPNHYLALVQQADSDVLLLWGKRILDASTLDEVFD